MIFRRLTLTDFGTYVGTQVLELAPSSGRPIVLIHGHNGAGKTTLLEAILLCLHGRRAAGDSVSAAAYERRIRSRFHLAPDGQRQPDGAAVSLELEHQPAGRPASYGVRRAWQLSPGGKLIESLEVWRDGVLLDGLGQDGAQDLLYKLIPPTLARLFLFDGEKIQELADDDSGLQLQEGVRRLLGLDVLGQLRNDLGRYAVSRAVGRRDDHWLSEASNAAAAATAAATTAAQEVESARAGLRESETGLAKLERRVADRGGALAEKRGHQQAQLQHGRLRMSEHRLALEDLAAGPLFLAACPKLSQRLLTQLESDSHREAERVLSERIDVAAPQLVERLGDTLGADPVRAIRELLEVGGADASAPLHDLSGAERRRLQSTIQRSLGDLRDSAVSQAQLFADAVAEVGEAESLLAVGPADEEADEMLGELSAATKRVAAAQTELTAAEDRLRAMRHADVVATRELRRAQERVSEIDQVDQRTGRAVTAIGVLEKFEADVARRKLREVELETARLFNRLLRKGSFVSDVSVDPERFGVRLTRRDGAPLPLGSLSAGERQLFATATLWALARVSKRPLPVVVDTPLARLDSEHRRRVLEEYLPNVSHQVIVLATDSEIGPEDAARLRPKTSAVVELRHDPATLSTTIISDSQMSVETVADEA